MAGSEAALKIPVEARLDQFGKDMETLGRQADSAVDKIGKSFASLNPGISGKLLTGVAGGIVGSIGLDKLLDVIVEANKQMADLEKSSKAVGLTLARFQELRFAGNLKGLDDSTFGEGINSLATKLNDAQRGENDLTKLLDANNVKYKDREGKIIDVNAALMISAKLIANAGTELDKVKIAEMLGLSKQWVPVLEQGAEQFATLAGSAREAGAIISDEVVAKAVEFDRRWKVSSANWSTSMRASALEILPYIDSMIAKAQSLGSIFGSAFVSARAMIKRTAGIMTETSPGEGKVGAGLSGLTLDELKALPLSKDEDSDAIRMAIAKRELAEKMKADSSAAASPLRLAVSKNNPTVIPTEKKEEESNAYDKTEERLQRQIALYDAQAASVGKTTLEKEKAKAMAELLAAAERAGIEVDEELKEKVDKLGTAYGEAAQRAESAKTAFEAVNDASRYFGNAVGNILDQIGNKTKGIDILRSSLKALTSELQRAILTGEGSFAKLLGTASTTGGTGGLAGAIGSLFTSKGGSNPVDVGSATSIGANAQGTDNWRGGPTWVGEMGPEIVDLPRGAQVVPNSVASRMGGGSPIIVKIINNAGADVSTGNQSQEPGGGLSLDVMIDQGVAKNMNTPGSQTNRALASTGARQRLVRR